MLEADAKNQGRQHGDDGIQQLFDPSEIRSYHHKDSERDARERAEKLLTDLGLSERMTHKPSELSGGEKQRVAAARAMVMNPDVILADEPSGSLDEANKHELHSLLQEMRSRFGQTIVIVTHDKELAAISDRVIELKDGKVIGDKEHIPFTN